MRGVAGSRRQFMVEPKWTSTEPPEPPLPRWVFEVTPWSESRDRRFLWASGDVAVVEVAAPSLSAAEQRLRELLEVHEISKLTPSGQTARSSHSWKLVSMKEATP